MNIRFLYTSHFWFPAIVTMCVVGAFFAWELNLFAGYGMQGPNRPNPTMWELVLTACILLLLSGNIGLYMWQKKFGSCPVGAKSSTSTATILGGLALLCPACAFGTLTFFGFVFTLSFLAPFIPLLQVIAILLLTVTFALLLPKT